MEKISIIFIGTGSMGTKTLRALASDTRFHIKLIITAPDKPSCREMKLHSTPIKKEGFLNKLIVQETHSIKDLKQKIIQENPDFLLVMDYGEIISKEILEIPQKASVNVHFSLLPKYRGATPYQSVLLQGEKLTGITWIMMNEKMDEGDIIAQEKMSIKETDDAQSLSEKLSALSAEKTGEVLFYFFHGSEVRKQIHSDATYSKKIQKEDGLLNFEKETAEVMVRKIKAYALWPGCYFLLNGKRIRVWKADVVEQKISSGAIEVIQDRLLLIGTAKNALCIKVLQPESKNKMTTKEFLLGQKKIPSSIFS